MPRDGSGNYSPPSGNPVAFDTTISETTHNATVSDMGSALTQSLSKDGQTVAAANLPMGGFKHTGVGAATLANQYATLGQEQSNVAGYVVDSSVTPNIITISPSPAITSYIAGQQFRVRLNTTNTAQTTITVSGLTAKNVFRERSLPLVAGDLIANNIVTIVYDGAQFIILTENPAVVLIASTGAFSGTTPKDFVLVPSLYTLYQLYLEGIYGVAGQGNPAIRFSIDGGASFISAGQYAYDRYDNEVQSSFGAEDDIQLADNDIDAQADSLTAVLWISTPPTGYRSKLFGEGEYVSVGTTRKTMRITGSLISSAAQVNAIRVLGSPSSSLIGNNIKLYGYR